MSTPEEIERERTQLVALSETMRKVSGAIRDHRRENVRYFRAALAQIRETNRSPEMEELGRLAQARNPDYDPHAVEDALEAFIERMDAELEQSERDAENTWLGIQESIIALDETGEVPPVTKNAPMLQDVPPRPGPDDDM